MTPEAQLKAFADRFDPAIAAQGLAAIDRLRALAPGAVEIVYDNYNALAVGFGPSEKASEAIVSIAFYPRWVTLFFLQGAKLDDPAGLLAGEGVRVRSFRLSRPEDLDRPDVQALIAQALERAQVPVDPSSPRRLAIRSVSARQRPRRPL
jgi:hypothetical protein